MNSAEIKFMKQECKRMIKENFAKVFDRMAQVIATEDFQNTVKKHTCEQCGAFELHISTEVAGVPVTGVNFYILETIGFLFGTGVEINGRVRGIVYDSYMESMDEISQRLYEDEFRESIYECIFKKIDETDDKEFDISE